MNLEVYYPGKSQVHRLDARLKVTGVLWLSLWVTWSPWQGLFINTLGFLLLLLLSHLPVRLFRSSAYAFLTLSIFYILATAWTWKLNEAFWQGQLSWDGLGETEIMLWRVGLVFFLTRIFAAITPPLEQGVGVAYLFTPLLKIFPKMADFVLILTLTLRFVPLLMEEALLLGKARMLKGAWPSSKFSKVIEISRIILPLLLLSFRRADEVAENLLARGYTSGAYQSVSFGEWTRVDQRTLAFLIIWPFILWGSEKLLSLFI